MAMGRDDGLASCRRRGERDATSASTGCGVSRGGVVMARRGHGR